ncbi:MAG: hypothetical protein J6W17_05935, partial [Campylobacter sp.]|nr:hypothetical protein [Campylobacter sp.]
MEYNKYIVMLNYCLKKNGVGLPENINKCEKLKIFLLRRKESDKAENNKEINQILENEDKIRKIDNKINEFLGELEFY